VKEKKKKAKKIRKVLKKRLNIDCLRMLCPKYCSELEEEDSENGKLEITSQGGEWFMLREVNDSEEESNADYINNFGDIYSVRDLLGVGAFGVVLLVKNRISGEKSALKIINKSTLSTRALKVLKNESKIMKSLDHSSVVSFKRIYEN
jgi:serine/threonine protein kinase